MEEWFLDTDERHRGRGNSSGRGSRRGRDRPFGMPAHQMQFYPPEWTVRGLPGHYYRTFSAALIFDARMQLGLNQKQFAELVGMPSSVLNRLENGRRDPNSGTLLSILYRAGFFVEAKVIRNYLIR